MVVMLLLVTGDFGGSVSVVMYICGYKVVGGR